MHLAQLTIDELQELSETLNQDLLKDLVDTFKKKYKKEPKEKYIFICSMNHSDDLNNLMRKINSEDIYLADQIVKQLQGLQSEQDTNDNFIKKQNNNYQSNLKILNKIIKKDGLHIRLAEQAEMPSSPKKDYNVIEIPLLLNDVSQLSINVQKAILKINE